MRKHVLIEGVVKSKRLVQGTLSGGIMRSEREADNSLPR